MTALRCRITTTQRARETAVSKHSVSRILAHHRSTLTLSFTSFIFFHFVFLFVKECLLGTHNRSCNALILDVTWYIYIYLYSSAYACIQGAPDTPHSLPCISSPIWNRSYVVSFNLNEHPRDHSANTNYRNRVNYRRLFAPARQRSPFQQFVLP